VGFVTICFSAGGERGICISSPIPLFIRLSNFIKMSAPNCAPLNLTQSITCIDSIKINEL